MTETSDNGAKSYMGENFFSALLIMGGMGLAVHFEQLSQLFGVPLIMAFGQPVSGSRPRWKWRCPLLDKQKGREEKSAFA